MKKYLLLSLISTLSSLSGYSQILKPITWSYAAKKTSATTAVVYIKATLDKGWHLYSQHVSDGGPTATQFSFPSAKNYERVGKTVEQKPITKFEPVFLMEVGYFEDTAVFQQTVKLKGKNAVVKGSVYFMVCNDKQCLPPSTVDFTIPVK